jgi:hypothetical protein
VGLLGAFQGFDGLIAYDPFGPDGARLPRMKPSLSLVHFIQQALVGRC